MGETADKTGSGDRNEFRDAIARAMKSLDSYETISPDEFPTLDLYMDQVTTFMERKLRGTLRHPKDDKILTKTMINNYAKNDLIPPPVKKKYSREHLFELLLIFYFKNFLSIDDIQTLLTPMTEYFFGREDGFGVEDVYAEILKMGRGARRSLKEEMEVKYERADNAYENAPEEYRDYLKKFAYICELGYDIFLKKSIIERMIDDMEEERERIEAEREEGKRAAKEAAKEAAKAAKETAKGAGKETGKEPKEAPRDLAKRADP